MYEFAGIFSLSDIADIKSENVFPKLLCFNKDYEYSYCTRNSNFKLFSREPIEKVYLKVNDTHYFMLGEAYTTESDVVKFCTIRNLVRKIDIEGNFLKRINGNFKIIEFNEVTKECIIYSSRLSIITLYHYFKNNALIISTNLSQIVDLIGVDYKYDIGSIIEQQLFFFPFNDSTIIEGVKRVQPSRVYRFGRSGEKISKYFNYLDYYSLEKKDNNEEVFIEKFYRITNGLAQNREKINVALTAGFDSRTIFGILKNRADLDIQAYAFGLKSSSNVSIPSNISKKLGFNFNPIYLDDEHDKNFNYWFELCTSLSDGYMGERTNYPFAYSELRKFSGISINGNWGSEAIRPMQNFTSLITKLFYDSIYAKDPEKFLDNYIFENCENMYVNKSVLIKYKDSIVNRFKEWRLQASDFPLIKQLHMYMFFENEPKYFSNETQTERIFCTTRYPYYDDDILRILFSSSFSGLTKEAFKRSFHSIYDSQKIYYSILSRFAPELLPFTTDHGYPPSVFGSILGKLTLSTGKIFKEVRNKLITAKDFNNHLLANELYKKDSPRLLKSSSELNNVFSKKLFGLDYNSLSTYDIFKVDNAFSILYYENILKQNADYFSINTKNE